MAICHLFIITEADFPRNKINDNLQVGKYY